MRSGHMLLVVCLVACTMAGCSSNVKEATGKTNVVVLLVDTLRADHLECYGYLRQTSPNLCRFAADNIRFAHIGAQASCTFPSVNSILTSRYPSQFLGQPDNRMGIPESIPSVATAFKQQGYRTLAVSASPVVRKNPGQYNPHGGFDRDFDVFLDDCEWMSAECVNNSALELLDATQDPFFLYLHYLDPHDPYRAPNDGQHRFAGEYCCSDFIAAGDPNPIADMLYADGPPVEVEGKDIQHLVDLYDEEISFFDQQFKTLLDELGSRGLLENTVIVITADHGEDFLENGKIKHCYSLSQSLVHIPLIISVPWMSQPVTVTQLGQAIDIVPTILDLVGFDGWQSYAQGKSLVPAIVDQTAVNQYAFSNMWPYRAVDDGQFKLILDAKTKEQQLFHLSVDPHEQHDVLQQEQQRATELGAALQQWAQRQDPQAQDENGVQITDNSKELLRSLGYLQ